MNLTPHTPPPPTVDNGLHAAFIALRDALAGEIVGQSVLVERLLVALLADGHLLVEGAPGLAKTTAIRALAARIDASFARIQFTPDLLPADLTGTDIWRPQEGRFEFQPGPVFHPILLADEINRAPAKVQSALLEAMGERQVTVGRTTYPLPAVFLVMATQNPIEQEGTYALPEAQVDRFLLKVVIGYPEKEDERLIIRQNINPKGAPKVNAVVSANDIIEARQLVREVYMDEKIEQYILDIVFATRNPEEYRLGKLKAYIAFGCSPRASISLAIAAKAYAFIKHRGYVIPEDIRAVCHDVLRHRIGITYEAEAENINSVNIIDEILNAVEVP